MPTFGDMENQGRFGASEQPEEKSSIREQVDALQEKLSGALGGQQGVRPADRSGVSAPELDRPREVQDDPAYQNRVAPGAGVPDPQPVPEATGAPRDGVEDVLKPLIADALARLAPDMGITWCLSVMAFTDPEGNTRIAPTLAVEQPAPILGRMISHGLQFMQMSYWTQDEADDVVRNLVEVLRQQRGAMLSGQAPVEAPRGGQTPSGLFVP